MSELEVFGTYHIDRPSKVRSELAEFSEGADIFFSEAPHDEADSSYQDLLLRNPTFRITGFILNLIWGVLGFILTRRFDPVDAVATESVARERDIDIEPVDMNLVRRASGVSTPVTVISWIWFFLTIAVFAFGIALQPRSLLVKGLVLSPYFFVFGAVAMGFVPVVPFAYGTLSERDRVMAENIESILATRDDIQKGCLIVGHKHMRGIIEELEQRGIDVGEVHKPKLFRRSL